MSENDRPLTEDDLDHLEQHAKALDNADPYDTLQLINEVKRLRRRVAIALGIFDRLTHGDDGEGQDMAQALRGDETNAWLVDHE